MIAGNKHIVHHAEVEFEITGHHSGTVEQDSFVDWTKNHVLSEIEILADEMTNENQVVRISDLAIDIPLSDGFGSFDSVKVHRIVREKIRKAIGEKLRSESVETVSLPRYYSGLITDYLETGVLPESPEEDDLREWKHSFLSVWKQDLAFADKVHSALRNKSALDRFFRLFSLIEIRQVMKELRPEHSEVIGVLWKFIQQNKDLIRKAEKEELQLWFLIRQEQLKKSFVQVLSEWIRHFVSEDEPKWSEFKISAEQRKLLEPLMSDTEAVFVKSPEQSKEQSPVLKEEVPSEGIWVKQSGLVLLSPFLKPFLSETGFLDENGQPVNQKDIPIFLHYLATGLNEAPEWDLSLPKLLSGLALNEHCAESLSGAENHDGAIGELLESVIGHWKALGKTSPGGLKETFINRQGVLFREKGVLRLKVEEKPVDILMKSIPWNFSMVRADWMREILFVDWN